MTTRYVSWTRSTHAQVECMDCRSGVGLGGYLKAKVDSGPSRSLSRQYSCLSCESKTGCASTGAAVRPGSQPVMSASVDRRCPGGNSKAREALGRYHDAPSAYS